MTIVLIWRMLKFVALLGLPGATVGAFASADLDTRQRWVYWLGTPSLALTWIAGFGLVRVGGISLGSPWIGSSVLLSVLWLHVLAWSVESDERREPKWAVAAAGCLLLALALMVFRIGG